MAGTGSVPNVIVESGGHVNITNITRSNVETIHANEDGGQSSEKDTGTDVVKLSDTIYTSTKPLLEGKDIYHGHQLHASGQQEKLAIKFLSKTKQKEIDRLLKLKQHSNIVTIVTSGKSHWIRPIYLAMELCGQNMQQYVDDKDNAPDPMKAMEFFKQVVSGLAYIHENYIAHHDLKPSNILISLDGKSVKISDFGISKDIPAECTKVTGTAAGTDGFMAPETIRAEKSTKFGYKADIFPLGINGYFIITHGKHPFGPRSYDWNHNIVYNKKLDLSHVPEFTNAKRSQLIELFKRMLDPDPDERPTASAVKEDEFFFGTYEKTAVQTQFSVDGSGTQQHPSSNFTEVQNILGMMHVLFKNEDVSRQLSRSLSVTAKMLITDFDKDSIRLVQDAIPEKMSAFEVLQVSSGLKKEEHLVYAILLCQAAVNLFKAQSYPPPDALSGIRDCVAQIRDASKDLLKRTDERYHTIASTSGIKFITEALQELRSVEHANDNVRVLEEATCLVSLSHLCIKCGKYEDAIPYCKDGVTKLELQFADQVCMHRQYGRLLNNIGEAHKNCNRRLEAKQYFQQALEAKQKANDMKGEARREDIALTQKNLDLVDE